MILDYFQCLTLLFLLTVVTAQFPKKLPIKTGKTKIPNKFNLLRKLDTLNNSLPSVNFDSSFLPDYAVQIDSDPSADNDDVDDMLIIISSSYTVLAGDHCSLFEEYTCQSPYCTENNSSTISLNYPFFSTNNATSLNLNDSTISLAAGAWTLNSSPLYINSCNFSSNLVHHEKVLGWIGLGLSSNGSLNFQNKNPIFSISIDSSSGEGELIFGYNSSNGNSSNPQTVLSSDGDWKMQLSNISFGPLVSASSETTLIFDLQYDGIALPVTNYNDLKNQFYNLSNVTRCEELVDAFGCVIESNLEQLPNLVFGLQDGSSLSIPPTAYLTQQGSDYYAIFNSFDTTFADKNYTVLGWQVMSHFYSVFQQNGGNNTITLYSLMISVGSKVPTVPNQHQSISQTVHGTTTVNSGSSTSQSSGDTQNTSSRDKKQALVIGIIICSGIFAGACFFLIKKRYFSNKASGEKTRLIMEMTGSDSNNQNIITIG